MSVRVMSVVWETECSHSERLVLLALADHADDEGSNAYPSTDRLAWKTGYSRRNVQSILKELRDKGWIVAENGITGGQGMATSYTVRMDQLPKKPPYAEYKEAVLEKRRKT